MDINSVIINAIEDRKQIKIKEYDEIINSIKNETNIATLYYSITKAYKNSNGQGEIQIDFLKSNFKNPFFQNAKVSNGSNYITFEDDLFKVKFCKGFSRIIEILYKNEECLSEPKLYTGQIDKNEEFYQLLKEYLKRKTFTKLKNVIIFVHGKVPKKINKRVKLYIKSYLKYNEDYMKEIVEQREHNQKKIKDYKIKLEKYHTNITNIENFIESLTDLKPFRESGCWIQTNILKNGIKLTLTK